MYNISGKVVKIMSTVSALANNTASVTRLTAKGVLKPDSSIADSSVAPNLSAGNSSSSSAYSLSDSLSALLKDPSSSQLNSTWSSIINNANGQSNSILKNLGNAYDEGRKFIQSVADARSSISQLAKDYTDTKSTFKAELGSTMTDLSSSISKMRSGGFYVKGFTEEDTQKNIKSVISNVADFAKNYNEAVGFMNDNSSVSKRVERLADSFADNTYFASSLNKIGISVDKKGALSIDETRLAKALENDNGSTSYTLGLLASRAENKVSMTNAQSDRLFPSISEMMGSSMKQTQALYSASALTRQNAYNSVGGLLDMYF